MIKSTTIQTLSGKLFDLADPHNSPVDIYDIAGSLAKLCRFTGHTQDLYSVAQHSVHVSHLVPEEYALEGLLHDAHEAYTGDWSKPLKNLLEIRGAGDILKKIEDDVTDAIMKEFGIFDWNSDMWHEADMAALGTEKRDQMRRQDINWPILNGIEIDPEPIEVLSYPAAEAYFLQRFDELLHQTGEW